MTNLIITYVIIFNKANYINQIKTYNIHNQIGGGMVLVGALKVWTATAQCCGFLNRGSQLQLLGCVDLGTIDTSRVVELSTQQPKNLGN